MQKALKNLSVTTQVAGVVLIWCGVMASGFINEVVLPPFTVGGIMFIVGYIISLVVGETE